MLASFIPFFLVARMAVDDGTWKHGPEYIFDVEVNITSTPMNHDGVQTTNYTVMNLYCRPKASDKLHCRLANGKRQSIDLTNNNKLDVPDEEMKQLYTEEPFEIKFNQYGVDYLIVNEHVNVMNLNDIKLIAERFNIGADLNGIPDGVFKIVENSTIGRCNVTVGINHYPSKRMMNKMKSPRYELESLPQLNKVLSEAIVIQKTANLSNCCTYAPFYFGSYGDNVVVEPDLHSHLESSTSRIYVSDYHYVSSLTRSGTLGSDKLNNLMAMSQYISVTLRDIRAAKRELDNIYEALKTSIMANSDLDPTVTEK